jgi:hypothetical protein
MPKQHFNQLLWVGMLITVISVLANLLFFAFTQALGEQYIIPYSETITNTEPMPVLTVALATAIPALLGILLYSLLKKFLPNALLPSFLSIAVTALLVSFGGPLDLPGAVLQTRLLLSAMHLIAAIIIVGGLLIFHSKNGKAQVE